MSETAVIIGNVTTDAHFHMLYADADYFHYFGDDVLYSILRTVHDADTERLLETAAALRDGQTEQIALRMRGASGSWRWMLAGITARSSGEHRRFQLNLSDAALIRRQLTERTAENTEYRFYLNLMRDLAFRYSFRTGRIRLMTFDVCRENVITDMPLKAWKQQAIEQGMVNERDLPAFEKLCADIEAGVCRFQYEIETSVCALGKRMETCAFRGVTCSDAPGRRTVLGTVGFLHAKYKSKEPGWLLEATRDSASDLLNKNAITAHAKTVLAGQPADALALVLLNIDGFREINERFGHLFGDEVLFTFSHILKSEIGTRGTAGRIGGGMFMLVLEHIADETDLRGILRAIRTKLEWAWESAGEKKAPVHVTCSMGAACYPADARTYEELFRRADKALYIAREKGHNRYIIYDVNKHGSVEMQRARDMSDLYAPAPTKSNAGFTAELIHQLMLEKQSALSVIQQIGPQFGLDGIQIFTGPEWASRYSWGHPVAGTAESLTTASFLQHYSEDHVCVIDNINALEGLADDVYRWLTAENLLGAVLYLALREGKPFAVISFGLFGHYRKWSTPDIGSLTVLGSALSALLSEECVRDSADEKGIAAR